jgi:hypothetical protein
MTDLQTEALRIIEEMTREAVHYFEKSVEASGIMLTDDLKNSFRSEITAASGNLLASATISFEGYGRLKDMKSLKWSRPANLDAMEEYVKKVGVDKFAYVPGYEHSSKIPTTNIAMKRIAAGIAWHRFKISTVPNSKSKMWYTKTLNAFVNVSRRKMMGILASYSLAEMKESLGAE